MEFSEYLQWDRLAPFFAPPCMCIKTNTVFYDRTIQVWRNQLGIGLRHNIDASQVLFCYWSNQTWYAQFPSYCAGNMELSTATSPFTNHQPRSVPDWTQIPRVQVRLHMTLPPRTIENWTNLLTYWQCSARLSNVSRYRELTVELLHQPRLAERWQQFGEF